ncbi:MAG: hypothetical protein KA745_05615 [Gemmatimonadales bacterium]|nr:hypothetical protein [Gemmatimonadales bacterium]
MARAPETPTSKDRRRFAFALANDLWTRRCSRSSRQRCCARCWKWTAALAANTPLTVGWPSAATTVLHAGLGGRVVPTGVMTMGIVLALVGFARAHVVPGGPWLRYATEAVYPFYIVHQTVTVAIVYAVVPAPLGVWPKFGVAAVTTFAGSWLVFEAVRRVPMLRPLFGLKGLRHLVVPSGPSPARRGAAARQGP